MTGQDGVAGTYSYLALDTSRDARTGPGARIDAPGPDSIYRRMLSSRQVRALAERLPNGLAAAIRRGLRG